MNKAISLQKIHKIVDLIDEIDVNQSTIINYKHSVARFIRYISEYGISQTTLLDYKRHLGKNNQLSVASKNKYLNTAKKFCLIAHAKSFIPKDISKVNGIEIKGFKISRLHKKTGLSMSELKRVVDYMNQLDESFKSLRLKLLFVLLFHQGLRQIEVSRLKIRDIDLINKQALIRGKGKDDKEPIVLQDITVKLIRKYLKACKRRDGYLFYALASKNANAKLNPSGIKKIIKDIFGHLKIDKTTHALRHSFVNQLLKYYDDLLVVASYSRHSNLNMIKVYADEINKELDRPKFNEAFKELALN